MLCFIAGPKNPSRASRSHFVKLGGVTLLLRLVKECADIDSLELLQNNECSSKTETLTVYPRASLRKVLNALVSAEGDQFGPRVLKHVLGSQGVMDFLVNHLVTKNTQNTKSVDYSRVHEFAGELRSFRV